jgi:predicted nucleic acid-binding protein
LEWVTPTLRIADVGAQLRANYNLRTPDALQAATALTNGATGFVSNHSGFRRITDLEVIVLDDLVEI